MTTIRELAHEFGAQPYEVAEFADLGTTPETEELCPWVAEMIREAWTWWTP